MKNFQMRLADDVYDEIKAIADERQTTIADVIRQSLEVYAIGAMYAREGKRLMWEDPRSGERADVLIPGFATRVHRTAALKLVGDSAVSEPTTRARR